MDKKLIKQIRKGNKSAANKIFLDSSIISRHRISFITHESILMCLDLRGGVFSKARPCCNLEEF